MKKNKQKTERFLVIVPHRDTRVCLRKYFNNLIKAGLTGAYTFPFVIPAARISKRLTDNELKYFAQGLRSAVNEEKFCASVMSMSSGNFSADGSLFGYRLEIDLPAGIFPGIEKNILTVFNPLIIGSFFVKNNKDQFCDSAKKISEKIPAPHISFRAAAAANMSWKSFPEETEPAQSSETVYKWKIGKLSWLPKR